MSDLAAQLSDVLHRYVGDVGRVALLGWPDHGNVGDSAIWLGQRECLRSSGTEVGYVASSRTFSQVSLRKRLGPDDVILFQGGGNLGDIWGGEQVFREEVVAQFGENRFVFLPQTVHFTDAENEKRFSRIVQSHGGISILVRDQRSYEWAATWGAEVVALCPDAAHALSLPRSDSSSGGLVLLLRSDREAQAFRDEVGRADRSTVVDWPVDPYRNKVDRQRRDRNQRRLRNLENKLIRRSTIMAIDGVLGRVFDHRAEVRLRGGLGLIDRAAVVVTDRLHAYILCSLIGKPCVALDNNYGKLSGYIDAWGLASETTTVASSLSEAVNLASNWR